MTRTQAKIWEDYFHAGKTDGRGHWLTPIALNPHTTVATQAAPVKKPSFDTVVKAKRGDKAALAEWNRWVRHVRGEQSAQDTYEAGLFGGAQGAVHAAARNAPVVNPVAGAVFESLSPTNWFPATAQAIHGGGINPAGIGLEALGIFPFGRAARLGKAAAEARGAARVAEKASSGPAEMIPDSLAEAGRKQVLAAMPQAQELLAQEEALNKVDRARRAAAMRPAYEAAGGGVPGHIAATKELAGEYHKADFSGLVNMDQGTLRAMLDAVQEHRFLTDHQKRNVQGALRKLQAGKRIVPFEIKLIHKAFGSNVVLGTASLRKGALDYVVDIVNIPRSLMATGDFSYRLRNGLFALALMPRGALKNTASSFKVTFSQPRFDELQRALHADPELQEAVDRGLALTDTGHVRPGPGREETFQSPLAETITGGKLSPVRAAGRNFTGNAIMDRAMIYKSLLEGARKNGWEVDDALKDSAVRIANWATGRSNWGHETLEMLTNTFLFAPKLFKTRLDVLNPMFYKDLHPYVRRQVVKSLVRLVAAGVGVLAIAAKYGADVELDPRSSDFGKIKIGNTRFDIWGGNQQVARTIAQLGTQSRKSTTTKKIYPLGHGEHFDPLKRLFEGKLSPPFSFGLDVWRGEMFAGQPLTAQDEALQRLSPLLWNDIYKAWQDEGAAVGVPAAVFGSFGVGTQTYPPAKTKPKRSRRSSGSNYSSPHRSGGRSGGYKSPHH